MLDYLGRYAFRIAISNSRLEKFDNGQVTFGYRDHKTQKPNHLTLPAQEFIRRFLRHVLPRGFVKVRSYGLWNAHNADKLDQARTLLEVTTPQATGALPVPPAPGSPPLALCPRCKVGHLVLIASLLPQRTRGP